MKMFIGILIPIFICVVMPIVGHIVIDWLKKKIDECCENQKRSDVNVTAKQFESWYRLNPDAWHISYTELPYRIDKKTGEKVFVRFTDKEAWKYVRFVERVEKEKEQEAAARELERVVSLVQEDIDAVRKKSADYLKESNRLLQVSISGGGQRARSTAGFSVNLPLVLENGDGVYQLTENGEFKRLLSKTDKNLP